jgi:type IV pilus biogenesis protein CpaD/CtpE
LAVLSLLILACAAVLLSGCASGEDVMTTATPPPDSSGAGPSDASGSKDPALAAAGEPSSSNLSVTAEQRSYLDALAAARVPASSDLMALSIGSYICQAHVAGQTDQAVRDFVLPLVRGDLHDSHPESSVTSMTAEVDDATSAYIRIATDRLC